MVPALVEGLEDVDEVPFGEAVEVGNDGVEFVDPVLLFVRRERTAGDADLLRPDLLKSPWSG